MRVSTLNFLQLFDTTDWATERANRPGITTTCTSMSHRWRECVHHHTLEPRCDLDLYFWPPKCNQV